MKIFPFSDLHGQLPSLSSLPDESILLGAGDICLDFIGSLDSVMRLQTEWLDTEFRDWALSAQAKGIRIITTGGNHDFALRAGCHRAGDKSAPCAITSPLPSNVQILLDRSTWVEGVGLIQGTPWSHCPQGWAYRLESESQMRDIIHYTLPVRPTDIWLCHQPPIGPAAKAHNGDFLGSEEVHKAAIRNKVKVLICGHIHSGAGIYERVRERPFLLINAALCNEKNELVRELFEVDFVGDHHD